MSCADKAKRPTGGVCSLCGGTRKRGLLGPEGLGLFSTPCPECSGDDEEHPLQRSAVALALGSGQSAVRNLFASCETATTQYGLEKLKQGLEGKTKMVQPDPRIDPEVYVTFLEISAKEEAHIKFSPLKFSLKDITFKTSCEIVGGRSQLAAAAAAKGAGAASFKMGASQQTTTKVANAAATAGSKMLQVQDAVTQGAKEKLGMDQSAPTKRTVKVDVTVDMVKEFMVEQIKVTVKDLKTVFEGGKAQDLATQLGERVLSNDSFRRFLEKAISDKAAEVATRLAKQKAVC